jgi:hypothetical protein
MFTVAVLFFTGVAILNKKPIQVKPKNSDASGSQVLQCDPHDPSKVLDLLPTYGPLTEKDTRRISAMTLSILATDNGNFDQVKAAIKAALEI